MTLENYLLLPVLNVIQIDPAYIPAPIEKKQVFGITFEQGRNELNIDDKFFDNIVTENKELTEEAKRDLAISMITLKYTQSNSVCYVKDGHVLQARKQITGGLDSLHR